jgi:hypothetical protein
MRYISQIKMIQNIKKYTCKICIINILKISESETSLKMIYRENKYMVQLSVISRLVRNPKFQRIYILNHNDLEPGIWI